MYSASVHQDLYQNLFKCFSTFIPIDIIQNILKQEVLDLIFDQIVNDKVFEKSETEIETFESKEDLKYPQEFGSDQPIVFILDDLNEKENERFSSLNIV